MLHKDLNRQVVASMRSCDMFSSMDDEQFAHVLSFSDLLHKQADQMIFQQGMDLTHIYYVLSSVEEH